MENERESENSEEISTGEEKLLSRRNFLDGLGKWSKVVIGAAVLGGAVLNADHKAHAAGAAWANRGGGGGGAAAWANRGGGGSAAWANRGAAWANRGGSWINRY